jgi:DNA-binding NarL/FixJ family response regulator
MLREFLMPFPDLTPERVRQVIEAAYTFRSNLADWADALHAALGPALDLGQGTLVGLVGFPEPGVRLEHLAARAGATRVHQAVVRLAVLLSPSTLRDAFFSGRVLGSSSGRYSQSDFARLEQRALSVRSRDAAGFCATDDVDQGVMVIAPSPSRLTLPAQPSELVRALGQHIGTGLRLQRVIRAASLEDPAIEAIFDPDGRTQRTAGMARMHNALDRLREFVRARARAPGDEGPGGQGGAWEAVIAGRWSLVDRFDTDGRRFVVAYRNPPGVLDPRRLTAREEGVTTLAAVGRSNKEISADLGIAEADAAALLTTALAKLGLASRTSLPIFWRDLQGRAWAVSDSEASLVALSRQSDPQGLAPLSASERAVANGLLAGLSEADIARARNSSRRAVAKHAATLFHKLGVHSRAELASKCAMLPSWRAEWRADGSTNGRADS